MAKESSDFFWEFVQDLSHVTHLDEGIIFGNVYDFLVIYFPVIHTIWVHYICG